MHPTGCMPVSSVRHIKKGGKKDLKANRKRVHIKIHNSCGLLFLLHCFHCQTQQVRVLANKEFRQCIRSLLSEALYLIVQPHSSCTEGPYLQNQLKL